MPKQRNPWGRPYAGVAPKTTQTPVVEPVVEQVVPDEPVKKKPGRPKKNDD